MFPRPEATTGDLTLEVFCERLRANPYVAALVLGGTTSTGLNPASDLDIAIVVDTHPCPARTGTTWVDGRLADMGFASKTDVLASFDGQATSRPDDWYAILAAGQVVYDRDGIFSAAERKPNAFETPRAELFACWDHTSYNVSQSRRYVDSDDKLYHDAFRMRMTYQIADVMLDYFAARHLPWRGEKAAIRYWEANDPDFKQAFFDCMGEQAVVRKFAAYEQLARRAWTPVGEPWRRPAISITPASGFAQEQALRFWLELAGGE